MFTMLTDGSKVEIRAIVAQDASMLQAFVRRLSARSRHFRFFSAFIELPMALLERLVNQDHRRGLALVALGEQQGNAFIIAEARCVLDEAERTAGIRRCGRRRVPAAWTWNQVAEDACHLRLEQRCTTTVWRDLG
jgi:hypothetical protein